MTEILSSIGSIFTSAIGWAGKVGETVVGTPLLLLFCAIPLVRPRCRPVQASAERLISEKHDMKG